MGINKELDKKKLDNYSKEPSKFKKVDSNDELFEDDLDSVLGGIPKEYQPEWAYNGDPNFFEGKDFTIEEDGTIVRK